MSKKYQPKYWNHRGRYEKRYQELFAALVPSSGDCAVPYGEVLRWTSKMYYDIYNNGGCNMRDMDFRQSLLRDMSSLMQRFADKLKIHDFNLKLHRFVKAEATDQENDEVVDVVICYVWEEHQKALRKYSPMVKLVEDAEWITSFLEQHHPYFHDGKPMETDLGVALTELYVSATKAREILKKLGVEVKGAA